MQDLKWSTLISLEIFEHYFCQCPFCNFKCTATMSLYHSANPPLWPSLAHQLSFSSYSVSPSYTCKLDSIFFLFIFSCGWYSWKRKDSIDVLLFSVNTFTFHPFARMLAHQFCLIFERIFKHISLDILFRFFLDHVYFRCCILHVSRNHTKSKLFLNK